MDHDAVFKSTAGGQAEVAEAVLLRLKRKGSGEHTMRAKSVLREGAERIRADNRKKPRDEYGGFESRTESVIAQPEKSTRAEDNGTKKKRELKTKVRRRRSWSNDSRISPLVDLTNATESDKSTQPSPSRSITAPMPPSIQSTLGE